MYRSHVNLPPRSFVHGQNLGAKMSAVPVALEVLRRNLGEFIGVANTCQ